MSDLCEIVDKKPNLVLKGSELVWRHFYCIVNFDIYWKYFRSQSVDILAYTEVSLIRLYTNSFEYKKIRVYVSVWIKPSHTDDNELRTKQISMSNCRQ